MRPPALTTARAALAFLGLTWLGATVAYLAGLIGGDATQPSGLSTVIVLIAAASPPAMLLAAQALARETAALRAEIAALRGAPTARAPTREDAGGLSPAVARAATEAARAAAAETARAVSVRLDRLEAALAGGAPPGRPTGSAPRQVQADQAPAAVRPAARPSAEQPDLPLVPPESPDWDVILRALDFPRDEADAEGFAALRAALADPQVAQVLQAAEDVLNILAAEALHMEDLTVDHAAPEAWRAWAEGARGPEADAIGGVRDPDALARTDARLKRDPIFRDAALVFVNRWSALALRALREIGDAAALPRLADTRSGRAFMLSARALGAFG